MKLSHFAEILVLCVENLALFININDKRKEKIVKDTQKRTKLEINLKQSTVATFDSNSRKHGLADKNQTQYQAKH